MPYKYQDTNPYRYRHCNHYHSESEDTSENECQSANTSSSGTTNLSRSTYISKYLNGSLQEKIEKAKYNVERSGPPGYLRLWGFRLEQLEAERNILLYSREQHSKWKSEQLLKRNENRISNSINKEFRKKLKSIEYVHTDVSNSARIKIWLKDQYLFQPPQTISLREDESDMDTVVIKVPTKKNKGKKRNHHDENENHDRNVNPRNNKRTFDHIKHNTAVEHQDPQIRNQPVKMTKYNLRPRKPLKNVNA